MLSTKQSDNFFMSKIKRSERLMSINTFDKPELFEMRRLNSYEFHRLTPPPPPPIYFFPSTRVTREALYCDFIEFR